MNTEPVSHVDDLDSTPSTGSEPTLPGHELPDYDLTASVSHLLRRAHFRGEALASAYLAPFGLTPRQKALLVAAVQHPGATINDLADVIALDRTSTAEMLKRLCERRLLVRRRSESDGRAWAVWITESGRALLAEVLPGQPTVDVDVLAPLPPDHRARFVEDLQILVGLTGGDAPAGPVDAGADGAEPEPTTGSNGHKG